MTSWHNRQWWRAELWLAAGLVVMMIGGVVAFIVMMK